MQVGENEPDFEYHTYQIGEAPPPKPSSKSKSWFKRLTKYFFPSEYEADWDQVSHTTRTPPTHHPCWRPL